MEDLRTLLDQVVVETNFDMGSRNPSDDSGTITFRRSPDEIVSSEEFRSIAESIRADDDLSLRVPRADMIVPDKLFSSLVLLVRKRLSDYIAKNSDRIGHAFPIGRSSSGEISTIQPNGAVSISCISELKDFVNALVRGAVIVGSSRLSELLSCWLTGEPVHYRVYVILNGMFLRGKLKPIPGIDMEPLPLSTDALPADLPKHFEAVRKRYLGRTLLKIDATAAPALFCPNDRESRSCVESSLHANSGLSSICRALTIASSCYVDIAFYWNDFQEVSALDVSRSPATYGPGRSGIRSLSINHSMKTDSWTKVSTLLIPHDEYANVSEKVVKEVLTHITSDESDAMEIAVSRWCSSKDSHRSMLDQFIDLRICMESLYLKDFLGEHSQEMKFRMALFGAWYLGSSFEERKEIRNTLRKAYDVASGVVHGRQLAHDEKNRELLSRTQELCRQGMEKLMKEGPPKDWGDLILGADCADETRCNPG